MKVNESTTDRVIRAIAGVLAIVLGYLVFPGTVLAIVLYVIGAILIFTAATGFCLLYRLFGNLSTVKHSKSPAPPANKMRTQRVNWYLLAAGVLTVALGFAHAAWGEQSVIAEVRGSALTELARASTTISWHQLTVTLLLAGVALLIISLGPRTTLTTFVALFVLAVVLGNVVVFAFYAMQFPGILGANAPELVIFAVLIVLLVLGLFGGRAKELVKKPESGSKPTPNEPS